MSIFGTIMEKIFHAAAPAPGTGATSPQPAAQGSAPQPAPAAGAGPDAAASATSPSSPAAAASAAAPQNVDVEAVLQQMASQKGGGGNWKTSIVDLLKLLDLESSLDARKQLASELGVHAGADGSAEENVALHKAVMLKLEENGGKVPASLKG